MSISALRTAVTNAGGSPTQYTHVGLLRQLITAWGGTPASFDIVTLLRQAITVKGGTPASFNQTTLLRQLITTLGGTPTSYRRDDLWAQLGTPTGSGSFPSSVDSAISIPTLALAVGQTTYPPQFNIGLDDTHAVGDTIWVERANDNGFTAGLTYYSHTLTLGEATAVPPAATIGLSGILSGTYRYRPYVQHLTVRSPTPTLYVTHGPDDQAPTLSLATASPIGATTATIGCTTDEGNGTLYTVVTSTNSAPSKAQVKAGQNSAGSAAVYAGNQAISSTGAKAFNVTGLTGGTTYYDWFMHEDSVGNQSTVFGGSFTTASGSVAVLYSAAAGTNRSQYIDVTGTPKLIATCNAAVGAACLVRSTDPPPSKFHFEVTVGTVIAGSRLAAGVSDSALALGAAVFSYPGTTGAGCVLQMEQGSTSWVVHINGSTTAVTAPNVLAAADLISFDVDTTANTVLIKHKRGGTTTTLGTYTLTSLIPTNWTATVGAGAANGDSLTVNFGASAFAVTPAAGHTGW